MYGMFCSVPPHHLVFLAIAQRFTSSGLATVNVQHPHSACTEWHCHLGHFNHSNLLTYLLTLYQTLFHCKYSHTLPSQTQHSYTNCQCTVFTYLLWAVPRMLKEVDCTSSFPISDTDSKALNTSIHCCISRTTEFHKLAKTEHLISAFKWRQTSKINRSRQTIPYII